MKNDELAVEVGAIYAGIRRMDTQIENRKAELADLDARAANGRVMVTKLEGLVADLKRQRESLLVEIKEYEEKIQFLRAEYKKLRAPLDAIPT